MKKSYLTSGPGGKQVPNGSVHFYFYSSETSGGDSSLVAGSETRTTEQLAPAASPEALKFIENIGRLTL